MDLVSFNIVAAVTIRIDFWSPRKWNLTLFPLFPLLFAMGPDAMILVYWMLSFKPAFSLSSFNFIKRLCSSSSLSAIKVTSSAYLRLLVFLSLPAVLIPACASSSLAFCMMYSTCKLNKQGNNIEALTFFFPNFEPVHCSMSSSNYCFLSCI